MTVNLHEWEQRPERDKLLINLLNQIQRENGYIPQDRLTELAGKAKVPEAQLHGLISFFNSFRLRPMGRHKFSVCYGTACYAQGAALLHDRLTEELGLSPADDTSTDGFATVEKVYCVGACSQAPLMVVDGQIHGKLKSYQVPHLLDKWRKQK